MEVTYHKEGEYYLPDLIVPEAPKVGRYGMLRRRFLRENRNGTYTAMLLTGRLWTHLTETDRQAEDMMERLTQEMAASMGVNEAMKAADQLEWVRRMNTIRHSAEESVLNDLIFS